MVCGVRYDQVTNMRQSSTASVGAGLGDAWV